MKVQRLTVETRYLEYNTDTSAVHNYSYNYDDIVQTYKKL